MNLRRPVRRMPEENVIPLINVVFLLLIFFMLVGTIEPPTDAMVEPPASDRAVAVGSSELVVSVAADGSLSVAGEAVEPAMLADRAAGAESVLVRADGRAASGVVMTVLRALDGSGVGDVRLLARPVEGSAP